MNTIIKAAGVADVEPIWATLFAKALEGKDVKDLLLNVGSGGGAAAAAPAAGGAATGGAAAAEEAPKEAEKEEGKSAHAGLYVRTKEEQSLTFLGHTEKEESDEDMGFGLFD